MDKQIKSETPYIKQLIVLVISLIIDLLAYTLILPLFVSHLEYYGLKVRDPFYLYCEEKFDGFLNTVGGPGARYYHLVLLGGILGSCFSLCQYLTTPLLASLSDIYGRKPMMLLSLFGIALSYAIWLNAYTFPLFVISRIIGGLTKCNISVAIAIVTDITHPEKRSRGMAAIGIAFSIGFLFGPLIGVYFSYLGSASITDSYAPFQYPAITALILSVINICFVSIFLEESLPAQNRAKSLGQGLKSAYYLLNPISIIRFDAVTNYTSQQMSSNRILGITYLTYMILFAGMEYALPFLFTDRLNFSRADQGKMYCFVGAIMITLQSTLVRRIKLNGIKVLALSGIISMIPAAISFAFLQDYILLAVGLSFYSYTSSTVVTALTTLASMNSSVNERGKVTGIMRSIGSLARGLGPFLVCALYWSIGSYYCFIFGAMLILLPAIIISKLKTPDIKQE